MLLNQLRTLLYGTCRKIIRIARPALRTFKTAASRFRSFLSQPINGPKFQRTDDGPPTEIIGIQISDTSATVIGKIESSGLKH